MPWVRRGFFFPFRAASSKPKGRPAGHLSGVGMETCTRAPSPCVVPSLQLQFSSADADHNR